MKRLLRIAESLKRPRVILASMVAGVLLGNFFPSSIRVLAPFDGVFFALLKMCALPIILTSVILALARLFKSRDAMSFLKHIFQVLLVGCLISGVIGTAVGVTVGKSVRGDEATFETLSKMVAERDKTPRVPTSFWDFLLGMIPTNVFESLAQGNIVSALLFVGLLGISIGCSRAVSSDAFLSAMATLDEALYRMIDWISYLLPFALLSLFAKTTAGEGGTEVLRAFGKLVGGCAVGLLALLVGQHLVMWWTQRKRMKRALASLKEPALIALSSSSSLATVPSLTESLESGFGIERWRTNLMLPLGVLFGQHASVFFYCALGSFVCEIYGINLGPLRCSALIVGSFIKSFAGAGLPALASVGLLEGIFRPLGFPVETLGVLLVTLAPVLDPFLTYTNVTGYVASACLINRKDKQDRK